MAPATPEPTTRADRPCVELSVVAPLYNERENLAELHRRLTDALPGACAGFELVLVNDGSSDETPELLDALATSDPRVRAVHLTRNFGHQAAISAGLSVARGDAVIVMDGDLQDPPEVLPLFIDAWRRGWEVVYAVRTRRKEGPLKRLAYFAFYRLLRAVSELEIPLDSGDFCLLDRKVVDALNALPERQRFVRGLRSFVGYRQMGLTYERHARAAGQPKYTLRALFKLAVDGLVSFSPYPLRLALYAGCLAALLAAALAVWAVADALTNDRTPRGWASTLVVVLFMGAVQLVMLGILGEYVRRVFLEVKGRPFYLIRQGPRPSIQPDPPQAQATVGDPSRPDGTGA
jgi:dolichol-phosphate mannosyltransferase